MPVCAALLLLLRGLPAVENAGDLVAVEVPRLLEIGLGLEEGQRPILRRPGRVNRSREPDRGRLGPAARDLAAVRRVGQHFQADPRQSPAPGFIRKVQASPFLALAAADRPDRPGARCRRPGALAPCSALTAGVFQPVRRFRWTKSAASLDPGLERGLLFGSLVQPAEARRQAWRICSRSLLIRRCKVRAARAAISGGNGWSLVQPLSSGLGV